MPLQGYVRFRKNQIGFQAGLGTAVAADHVLPLRGRPNVDNAWTEQDVDTGNYFPTLPPYRGPQQSTLPLTGQLDYNTAVDLFRMLLGPETPSGGTAYTWGWQISGGTAIPWDYATIESLDDADEYQLKDCILESLRISIPEGLGALTVDAATRVGTTTYPGTATPGLAVSDLDYHLVYGKDAQLFLDSAGTAIGDTPLAGALQAADVTISNTIDEKRFADGTQSFGASDFGRAGMAVNARFTLAKTDDVLAECENWAADAAVDRYLSLVTTSVEMAEGTATPFSMAISFPGRWYVHEEAEIGGNAVVVLESQAFADADLYALKVDVVSTNSGS